MRSFDEALAASRDGSPFPNHTAYEIWSARWCERCRWDRNSGCPLILVALNEKTPAEWVAATGGARLLSDYRCTEFREDRDGDDSDSEPDPSPPPEIPGQIDLFTAAMLDSIETELSKPLEVPSGR